MKPEEAKHPGRDRWCLLQQMDAWHTFKNHMYTIYLEDASLRDRIFTVIANITDPFAVEIRYHSSCWKKFISPIYHEDDNSMPNIHLQSYVHLAEVCQLFLIHVHKVILDLNEPRTLQGLLLDYNNILHNFRYDESSTKSSTIKQMIEKELKNKIGFHDRFVKNTSTIVYNASAGGSCIEAAINSWGVSDVNTVARRLKEKLEGDASTDWPPHVEELEQDKRPYDLLRKLLTWLKNSAANDFRESCLDPEVVAVSSLLFSFITGKHIPLKIKLSMTVHGITRSREIIDLLKKFSLGTSYQDVLNLYATWTKHDMEKNDGCLEELAEYLPGVAIMDNDDFQDDTLTGAETSHRTNVMFVDIQ